MFAPVDCRESPDQAEKIADPYCHTTADSCREKHVWVELVCEHSDERY